MDLRLGILMLAVAGTFGTQALAGPVTVTNGSFEQVTSSNGATVPSGLCSTGGSYISGSCANVTGWTNADGYSFISNSANLGAGYAGGNVSLYSATASPDGGNFVAVDGDMNLQYRGGLSQALSGLSLGDNYAITFYQAAGEQTKFSSPTTEQWRVSLGNSTLSSQIMNNPAGGFTGWIKQTLVFNASSASEVLSFFAVGTPSGEPPFVLLDGVSVTDVPEPATCALLGVGLVGMLATRRRRARITARRA